MLLAFVAASVAVSTADTDAAQLPRRSAQELRDEYLASAKNCRNGHNSGVVVSLHQDSMEPEAYLDMLRARAISGDEMRHHYTHTLRGVAARLSERSLDHVLNHPHTKRVHADCIHYMPKIERRHLGQRSTIGQAKTKAVTELAAVQKDADVASSSLKSMVASGVIRRDAEDALSEFWNWGPDRVDSERGTDDEYHFGNATGRGVRLYAIDTGVYRDHEDFDGRIVGGYSIGCPTGKEKECGGRWLYGGMITEETLRDSKFLSESGERCDTHGTHTASTAAGTRYGVAKEAEIFVVQGLDCNGTASNSMFIASLDHAVKDALEHGQPAVMTMSLGGERDDALDEAAERAASHGYVVVSASGNDGGDSCLMSPGASSAAISVAAIGHTDELASYSNHGTCTNVIAPGTGIIAAAIGAGRDSAAALSGTSMATPHVAGAVAQLLQYRPKLTPRQVSVALTCLSTKGKVSGLDLGTPNRLLRTGVDLDHPAAVQALDAVEAAVPPTAEQTNSTSHAISQLLVSPVCSGSQPARGRRNRRSNSAESAALLPDGVQPDAGS